MSALEIVTDFLLFAEAALRLENLTIQTLKNATSGVGPSEPRATNETQPESAWPSEQLGKLTAGTEVSIIRRDYELFG